MDYLRQFFYQRMGPTFQLFVCVLLLYCCSLQVYGDRHFQVTALNTNIDDAYWIKSIKDTSLKWCADMCVYVTDCMSVTFNVASKKCELYRIDSTSGTDEEYVMDNGTALMDISSWIQGRTKGCWEKPCGPSTLCTPNNQLATCIPFGCALYPPPAHGWDNLNRSEDFVNIGRTVQAGCYWPYMTTVVNSSVSLELYCRGNWLWSSTYRCYTVEELCNHHILEPLYANLIITVTTGNEWDARLILFSSTSGWNRCEGGSGGYVQVEFEQTVWIGGFATKGHGDNGTWVTDYRVMLSFDCLSFTIYSHSNGTYMDLKGNDDPNSIQRNVLAEALQVRCVRVLPNTGCGIRLEIRTCKDYTNVD